MLQEGGPRCLVAYCTEFARTAISIVTKQAKRKPAPNGRAGEVGTGADRRAGGGRVCVYIRSDENIFRATETSACVRCVCVRGWRVAVRGGGGGAGLGEPAGLDLARRCLGRDGWISGSTLDLFDC